MGVSPGSDASMKMTPEGIYSVRAPTSFAPVAPHPFVMIRHASGSQTPQPVEIFKQLTAHPSASEGGLSIATAATNSAVVAAKQFSRVRSKEHLACSLVCGAVDRLGPCIKNIAKS